MTELWQRRAVDVASEVQAGTVSAATEVEAALRRIGSVDPKVGAFLVKDGERAVARASEIDRRRDEGETVGRLAGVPFAIKDNMSLEGTSITCGSQILEGYVAPYTATAVERLLAEDAVPVGTLNMDEFAMGSSCENSSRAVTRNPWHLDMVPGGSSGGAAAAVAASMVPLALGSDTGGSIRQPAALCGVVGVKPTYGLVSRYGLVAFASSLDQIGPVARSVEDAALCLEVIAGHDDKDSTSAEHQEMDLTSGLEKPIEALKVGVLDEVDLSSLDADTKANFAAALEVLERAGATLERVSVPNLGASVAAYYVLANSEASANLARFDGVRYGARSPEAGNLIEMYMKSRSAGFGAEVKRRIMLGTFALSSGYYDAYYERARGVVRALEQQFAKAFADVDVLVTPTTPSGAFELGEKVDDPLEMYLSDIFTTPASLAGLPAVAVPSGYDGRGLPLSLQIMGRPYDDALVLRVARTFERELALEPQPSFQGAD